MADDYEKEYMGGDGALFVERVKNKRLGLAVIAGLAGAIFGGINGVMATGSILPALAGLLFAGVYVGGLALFFAFTRVSVTRTEVHVQLGMLGPKIPVSAITSVEKTTARRQFGIASFTAGGTGIVRITWAGKNGRTGTVLVGSDDPDGLVAAIERARSGDVAPAAQVRVDPALAERTEIDEAERDARPEAKSARAEP